MAYVISEPKRAALPVAGTSDTFPVRRVYCVGRNYAAHAREMGHDPDREPPFFFLKPADALQPMPEGGTAEHPYPPQTERLPLRARDGRGACQGRARHPRRGARSTASTATASAST
jgi:hypothetical protein